MNHRRTSTRCPQSVSALAALCLTAVAAAGAVLWTDQPAQRPSAVAASIEPEWNNTGNEVHPPIL
ncbi:MULTISPECIES: hypothetical protein [Streptomyces]|jgi:hypothetical protein|uniref:hypothetical protein n=1 Tax=Streptomyces TaxID=1883 RepID=UPI000F73A3B0|nr:hypothetical protein [Streptomyces sp. WAC05292]RSS93853.1 hypothetical protein EF903_07510 [Streptomyces sp. WAC05292]